MSLVVSKSPQTILRQVRRWRAQKRTVAFVPTMGYLHEGHLSLVALAKKKADKVVASIFVNPKQFGAGEDLESYPRDTRGDLAKFKRSGVHLCFTPSTQRMYPPHEATRLSMPGVESKLEGAARPEHFAGVMLVVLKLLHITEPDILVLGQKDAQQAVILEKMIADLNVPVRVLRGPDY